MVMVNLIWLAAFQAVMLMKNHEELSYKYHFLPFHQNLPLHGVQYRKYPYRGNFDNTRQLATIYLTRFFPISTKYQYQSAVVMLVIITQVIQFFLSFSPLLSVCCTNSKVFLLAFSKWKYIKWKFPYYCTKLSP